MKFIVTAAATFLFLFANAQKNPLIGIWKFSKIDVKGFSLSIQNVDSVTNALNTEIFENAKNDGETLTKEDSLAIYTKTSNQIDEFTSYILTIEAKNIAFIYSSGLNNGKALNKKGNYLWLPAKNKILLTFKKNNGKTKTEIFYYNAQKNILYSTETVNGYKNYMEFSK